MITYPCQPSAFSHNPAALVQLPWYGLMVLGCYALLCLAIDFWHFNDVTQASDELGQVRLAAVCGCDSAVRLIGAASCVPRTANQGGEVGIEGKGLYVSAGLLGMCGAASLGMNHNTGRARLELDAVCNVVAADFDHHLLAQPDARQVSNLCTCDPRLNVGCGSHDEGAATYACKWSVHLP